MKKVLLVLAIAVVFMGVSLSNALAVPTISGSIVGNEWDDVRMYATDPNESGIDNHYDMSISRAYWTTPGGDMYLLLQTYDTPSLQPLGSGANAFVYWSLDLNGDNASDLSVRLTREVNVVLPYLPVVDGDFHYYIGATEYGTDYWAMGSVIEILIPSSELTTFDPAKFQMQITYDNAGGSGDDFLPDNGWQRTIPEPASMSLLGMGLLGAIGIGFKRRKK